MAVAHRSQDRIGELTPSADNGDEIVQNVPRQCNLRREMRTRGAPERGAIRRAFRGHQRCPDSWTKPRSNQATASFQSPSEMVTLFLSVPVAD